ncbi:DegT/DnrJ/EryC1/StrS family aminotransferase [Aliikangiella sp. IMCC44653]
MINIVEFIDLKKQYKHVKLNIDNRISKVLEHGTYIMGPEVYELEDKLSHYVGTKHVITCANGTDALQLALMALNIGPGDAVFCPTFTFFATAEVIALVGATPVFVDIDRDSFNICSISLEQKIESVIAEGKMNAKAIIAVDLFGLPADFENLEQIARKYNLQLIEDAAQGFGGEINGKKAGSFGDIATTSFFPAKPLGCYGDGGAIFTNNDELAEIIKSLRVHGKGSDKYDNVRIGLNSRLDTIQAAILLEKLSIFPLELENRNTVANFYSRIFDGIYETPKVESGCYSSWAQYTLKLKERELASASFSEVGIPTMVYYRTCLHKQPAFQNLNQLDDEFPVASKVVNQVLSLPMHPYLIEDIELLENAILAHNTKR